MSAAAGAGPTGLQRCRFSKAESGLVCLGAEPEIPQCLRWWGATVVAQIPVLQERGLRVGCCGEHQALYSGFDFVNVTGFVHKMELKNPFTMVIPLPRPLTMFKRISLLSFFPLFLTVVMNFHQNNCRLGFNSVKTTLINNNFSMEGWDLGPLFAPSLLSTVTGAQTEARARVEHPCSIPAPLCSQR